MADRTKIEWTDATVNAVNGCSVLSRGCTNCYAMRLAGTRMRTHPTRAGLTIDTKAGPVWNGQVRFHEAALLQPLRWAKPRMIFWNAHGDLFHDSVPDEWIDRVFAVCALTPQHTHQILTKRSARMRAYMLRQHFDGVRRMRIIDEASRLARDWKQHARAVWHAETWPLANVWLGVSAEDQPRWDERTADLRETPAAVRWISAEPLLGPIEGDMRGLDWVVAGGESGPRARPMHPDWARSLRDQCAAAGVPFLFKQWGEWEPALDRERDDPDWRADYTNDFVDRGKSRWLNLAGGSGFHGERFHVMRRIGKKLAGRKLDGVEHDGYPARVAA